LEKPLVARRLARLIRGTSACAQSEKKKNVAVSFPKHTGVTTIKSFE